MKEEALRLFIFFFGGYIFFNSLHLSDKKKRSQTKKKNTF